jgi:CubicO group peptidase (beta-lactamase class C family)
VTYPPGVGLDRIDEHMRTYVDDGRLAGWQLMVSRGGEIAHTSVYGMRDLQTKAPVTPDTRWRIYSMTKPITSVAAMILWEEGHFRLTDEISTWLPEFADMTVYGAGAATEPIRVWQLFTHTAGMTYDFMESSPLDALYREHRIGFTGADNRNLGAECRRLAGLPLLFEPGSGWNYSVSVDVLGRLIEVISGRSLDAFLTERVFTPLGMTDTVWWDGGDRLATLYTTGLAGGYGGMDATSRHRTTMRSGGGGLLSTAADYQRFTAMLLRRGAPILDAATVATMTTNHLPGGVDVPDIQYGEKDPTMSGVGFGLGFAVVRDAPPVAPGTYYWGGAASTLFWVDPANELTVEFYTHMVPSIEDSIRPDLCRLVYAALS